MESKEIVQKNIDSVSTVKKKAFCSGPSNISKNGTDCLVSVHRGPARRLPILTCLGLQVPAGLSGPLDGLVGQEHARLVQGGDHQVLSLLQLGQQRLQRNKATQIDSMQALDYDSGVKLPASRLTSV